MIRVLLAEDHQLFRESLASLLESQDDIEVVGNVANGEDAVLFCSQNKADVILMDLEMEGMGGEKAAYLIKEKHPLTRIIILTMHDDYAFIQRLIQSGIDGYLLKTTNFNELLNAIRKVNKGETHFDRKAKDVFIKGHRDDFKRNRTVENDNLTEREQETLKLISLGHSNAEISEKLNISAHTVASHRKSLIRKTGCNTTADLTRYAIRNKFIDPIQ